MVCALTAAFVSIPLIFDYHTVLWFNEHYVTSGQYYFRIVSGITKVTTA